ncbi:hypothetical protein EW026_g6084 [Hermanssonia centrifuga]|uniref:H-type lectin domain-containing protein n=1 Tax=Hermanssonia centrifuga TaxID=98765 RepID=A0A4S4KC28_9APHY|nr:hypothetical protein EW026_g6084 [Hermanssonia centrifuga]
MAMTPPANNNGTVFGSPMHVGEKQQWRFVSLGGGWIIQSVSSGEYLTLEEAIGDGTTLSTSSFPVTWKVDAYEENVLSMRILRPNGNYALQLTSGGISLLNEVQIAPCRPNEPRQAWLVIEHHEENVETTQPANPLFPSDLAIRQGTIDTGTFNTASIRPWHRPEQDNIRTIHFSVPSSTPYTVLLGIHHLAAYHGVELSLKCDLLSVADNSARLNLKSWGNTIQNSSGCAWLSFPAEDPDFQSGRFESSDYQQTTKPEASTRIAFAHPYAAPPKVVVWLDTIHTDADTIHGIRTYASDISADGFILHLGTWHDTKLRLAGATWAAYSAGRTDICSGSYNTCDVRCYTKPQLENSARIAFGGSYFPKPPRVFLALNSLDIDHQQPMRIDASATDITNTGMTWHINSWDDTIMYAAGASFIAFDQ